MIGLGHNEPLFQRPIQSLLSCGVQRSLGAVCSSLRSNQSSPSRRVCRRGKCFCQQSLWKGSDAVLAFETTVFIFDCGPTPQLVKTKKRRKKKKKHRASQSKISGDHFWRPFLFKLPKNTIVKKREILEKLCAVVEKVCPECEVTRVRTGVGLGKHILSSPHFGCYQRCESSTTSCPSLWSGPSFASQCNSILRTVRVIPEPARGRVRVADSGGGVLQRHHWQWCPSVDGLAVDRGKHA